MRTTALLAAAGLLTLTGCGAAPTPHDEASEVAAKSTPSPTATPTAKATKTLTPAGLPKKAPRTERKQSDANDEARRFTKDFVRTSYFSLATRDFAPAGKLVADLDRCHGCADSQRTIDSLIKQQQYQMPGDLDFRSTAITGRQGTKRIVSVLLDVAPGTYFDEQTGAEGVLGGIRGVRFQVMLDWHAKHKHWRVMDYTIDEGRE